MPLKQLRDLYRQDLFTDFLPFMDRCVIDPSYGGFLCETGMDGSHSDYYKHPWFEGRGIWVYSFLYNHIERNPHYLNVARRSLQLLMRSRPPDGISWPVRVHRNGAPASGPDPVIHTNLGIAEGMLEYALAVGESQYWDWGKRLLFDAMRAYDRPEYFPGVSRVYLGPRAPLFPGARGFGAWSVLLGVASAILRHESDPHVEQIAARAIEAVVHHHFNPEFALNNELLNHDLSRPPSPFRELVYPGDTFEITSALFNEALRRHDHALFELSAARLRRHAAVARDAVYGGVYFSLINVDSNRFRLHKLLWAQTELMIASLYALDYTGAGWARELFSHLFQYTRVRFSLHRYGSPLWMYQSDRRVTFAAFRKLPRRVEQYHFPRQLMLNLLRIDHILARHARLASFPCIGHHKTGY